MRKSLIAVATALAIAGGTAGSLIAHAAPPPPPPGGPGMMGGPMGGPGGPHPHPWGPHPGMWGRHHRPLITPGTFALLFHPKNREITSADATAIATGFLRWNGNHTWKVVDVKAQGDNKIGFAYATADNSVIARFTINTHTGRIRRVG